MLGMDFAYPMTTMLVGMVFSVIEFRLERVWKSEKMMDVCLRYLYFKADDEKAS